MPILIRAALPSDAEIIADYNAALAEETEHIVLDRARLVTGVRAVLADPSKGFYTVAEDSGQVVGQMLITFEWSDWRNGMFWWVQSVYVQAGYRGRGVFKQIYRHVEAKAKAAGNICGLRLYVERENTAAQQTYQRLGMVQAPYDVYEVDFVIRRP